jgi:carbamoyltransferase
MVFQPGYANRFLQRVLGVPPRQLGEPLTQEHFDLAAALQQKTEEVVFHLLELLRKSTTSRNLCLAGGVFQNSVLNGKLLRSGLYDRVHVPPVPGDHGAALNTPSTMPTSRSFVLRTMRSGPSSEWSWTP